MALSRSSADPRRVAAGLHEGEGPGKLDEELEIAAALGPGADQRHLGLVGVAEQRREDAAADLVDRLLAIRTATNLQHALRERLLARQRTDQHSVRIGVTRTVVHR